MCDPLSIAASALVVGTGASIYGQIKSGKAAKKAADAEAASVKRQADYQTTQIRDAFERYIGAQGGNIAKSGRAVGGSALDIIADSAIDAETQIAAVKTGAAQQAQATISAGKRARSAAYFNAAATGITGVSSFLSLTNAFSAPQAAQPFSSAAGTSTGRLAGSV